ncbi:hypothetical protein ANTHELSMS3_02636 [Antarctobacter heliothermus]|uniref:YetF C-terminal domain-containing protein n=1 Tax=Antarctobacter heliothermus TaxID=74033 RepID=A0A222E518_9RHOB|nr:YetF domain-containing protein [Antarctobacter heliothermus]ASP21296.1 hypothetical protein ANTHELSMS3_02636 [Antarctobacter heliothermus]
MFFEAPVVDAIAKGALLSGIGLAWIIVLVRIVGLRSFSKLTNFDFVMTIAMGSLLAGSSQSQEWIGFLQTVTAMACLFAVQYSVSRLRRWSPRLDSQVENTPVLLVKDGAVQHDTLRATRVAEEDLMAKLREANALHLSSVRAAVLETTGNISVLYGERMDEALLKGVAPVKHGR